MDDLNFEILYVTDTFDKSLTNILRGKSVGASDDDTSDDGFGEFLEYISNGIVFDNVQNTARYLELFEEFVIGNIILADIFDKIIRGDVLLDDDRLYVEDVYRCDVNRLFDMYANYMQHVHSINVRHIPNQL